MFKPLSLLALLPISACTLIELSDKTYKSRKHLPQAISLSDSNARIEKARLHAYTIDPNKDNVIVEEWNEDQPGSTKKVEAWDLTERKPTSYVIENISRVSQNKDNKRGPMKIEVNLALDRVILEQKNPTQRRP